MGGSPARHTALKTTSLFCLSGEKLEVVQKEVADMLKGRVLVGHAVHNDLKVPHPHASQGLPGFASRPSSQYRMPVTEFCPWPGRSARSSSVLQKASEAFVLLL